MIDRLCLATFLRNLKGTLGERVRERFVSTMDEAVVMARNYELAGVTESAKVSAINNRGARRGNGPVSTPLRGQGNVKTSQYANDNPDKDIVCFNCEKPGHRKINCWAEGGGAYKGNANNNSNAGGGGRGGFRG